MTACPKCGTAAISGRAACGRCGLVVARWPDYRDETPAHPAIDEAFAELVTAWQNPDRHAAFIQLATTADALDLAAAHYRRTLRARPDDAPAKKALEQIAFLVEKLHAELAKRDTSVADAARRLRVIALAIAAIAAAGVAWFTWAWFRR